MCASRGLKTRKDNYQLSLIEPRDNRYTTSHLAAKKPTLKPQFLNEIWDFGAVPILSMFPALIVHSDLKSVHPGFPVALFFKHKLINK